MRIKKGFTLAEILIVLMVIGVIATMTIPGLMRGVTEAQFKTAYRKAYNTIVNLAAMERISGQLPSKSTASAVSNFFVSMNSNLSVASYVANGTSTPNSGTVIGAASYLSCLMVNTYDNNATVQTQLGEKSDSTTTCGSVNTISENAESGGMGWIVTEDNLAYNIILGNSSGGACSSKIEINGMKTAKDAKDASCAVIIVDVNGLSKGPNLYDKQVYEGSDWTSLGVSEKMDTLSGDQYPIFLASDGATAGPKGYTVTGRIAADLK